MLPETVGPPEQTRSGKPPTLGYLAPQRRGRHSAGTWDIASDYLGGAWLGGFLAIPVAAVFGWMLDVCGLTALCWVFGLAPALILAITLSVRSRIDRTPLHGINSWLSMLAGTVWSAGLIGAVIAARAWRVPAANALTLVVLWTLIQPIAASFLVAARSRP